MAKLNDADVARLLGALRPPDEAAAPGRRVPSDLEAVSPSPLAGAIEQAVRDGSLRQALEASIQSCLGAHARAQLHAHAADDGPHESLRFVAEGPTALQLDIDERFGAALADIIIGGSGSNVKHAKPARVGRVLEPFARTLLAAVAMSAGLEPLGEVRWSARTQTPVVGCASGAIGIGQFDGAWRVSEVARAPIAQPTVAAIAPPTQPARAVASTRSEKAEKKTASPPDKRPAPAAPRERVLAKRPHGPDVFTAAVDAACRQLAEFTRCKTDVDALQVRRVESPVLARGDLKLALIAGGQGSLVLSADRVAVASVAAAAVGSDLPLDAEPGAVTLDAVEAVLRGAMRGFAEKLPAIAGAGARFVRLAEGALPARSPHYEIAAPIHLGQREATLQWLVPAWMAGAVAPSSPDAG